MMRAAATAPAPTAAAARGPLWLAMLGLALVILQRTDAWQEDARVYLKYQPLAMDESVTISRDGENYSLGGDSPFALAGAGGFGASSSAGGLTKQRGLSSASLATSSTRHESAQSAASTKLETSQVSVPGIFDNPYDTAPENVLAQPTTTMPTKTLTLKRTLRPVLVASGGASNGASIAAAAATVAAASAAADNAEVLQELPAKPDSQLTKMIVNKGQHEPIFRQDMVEPVAASGESANDESILASYKLFIPVLLPGIRMSAAMRTTRRPLPVKFVKEVKTEMVPMKRLVPRYKEVIRAERVPQRLVTDYVTVQNGKLPARATDAVLPGENVVKTTVNRVD